MTLIAASDYGPEILVLADTRVSDPEGNLPPKDQLIKLITINFFHRKAVLGFSGNVIEVKRILEAIKLRAKHYRSSGSLTDDLKRWMEEVIHNKPEFKRHHLWFLLCDFDPSDPSHIHVYELNIDGEVRLQPQEAPAIPGLANLTVIGSGGKYRSQIYKDVLHLSGSSKGYESYEAYSRVRAVMTEVVVSSRFEGLALKDVGGPFTTYLVRPDEIIGPDYMIPTAPDMQVAKHGDRTILYSPSTNQEYTLFSIFAYTGADFSGHENACANSL